MTILHFFYAREKKCVVFLLELPSGKMSIIDPLKGRKVEQK